MSVSSRSPRAPIPMIGAFLAFISLMFESMIE